MKIDAYPILSNRWLWLPQISYPRIERSWPGAMYIDRIQYIMPYQLTIKSKTCIVRLRNGTNAARIRRLFTTTTGSSQTVSIQGDGNADWVHCYDRQPLSRITFEGRDCPTRSAPVMLTLKSKDWAFGKVWVSPDPVLRS